MALRFRDEIIRVWVKFEKMYRNHSRDNPGGSLRTSTHLWVIFVKETHSLREISILRVWVIFVKTQGLGEIRQEKLRVWAKFVTRSSGPV